jgi:hypothetical protein
MRIEVEKINNVHGVFVGGGHPDSIAMDVLQTHRQAETLFYQLWEMYEGGLFEEWINAEGYILTKKIAPEHSKITA